MHDNNVMPGRKQYSRDWTGVSLDPLIAIQGSGSKDLIFIRLEIIEFQEYSSRKIGDGNMQYDAYPVTGINDLPPEQKSCPIRSPSGVARLAHNQCSCIKVYDTPGLFRIKDCSLSSVSPQIHFHWI